MIVDSRRLAGLAPVECDVCIVGAGAAGLAVALELAKSRCSICVLEAGGRRLGNSAQSMLAGETGDSDYPPLHTVRVAGIGGSMRVWAGWCRPLDEIDFEERAAVPYSGWPIGLDELRPFYAMAHEFLDLGPFDYDPAGWERQSGTERLHPAGQGFASVLFRQSRIDLGMIRWELLERSANIRLLLHANALRLRFSADARAVTAVEVATLNGRRFEVRPKNVVAAAGGIETARLLLQSPEAPRGPANPNGLVGRFFTEHGYDDGAVYLPSNPRRPLSFYYPSAVFGDGARRVARGALAPAAQTLRGERLLNCAIWFRPAYEAHPIFGDSRVRASLELWDMLRSRAVPDRRLARALHALSSPRALVSALWRRCRHRAAPVECVPLLALFESAPDPDNRVVLGDARDALGRPVVRLQWRMTDLDLQSVARVYQLLDAALRSAGVGRLDVRRPPLRKVRSLKGAVGEHHLGTTRMHRDASKGVVDQDAKVHGVDNLFIAGGSVFTTGGCANPTLTLVALALRLARHLERRIRASR